MRGWPLSLIVAYSAIMPPSSLPVCGRARQGEGRGAGEDRTGGAVIKGLLALSVALTVFVSGARAETIQHLAQDAACRTKEGVVRAPRVLPKPGAAAHRAPNGMIATDKPVGGADCYLYPAEAKLGTRPSFPSAGVGTRFPDAREAVAAAAPEEVAPAAAAAPVAAQEMTLAVSKKAQQAERLAQQKSKAQQAERLAQQKSQEASEKTAQEARKADHEMGASLEPFFPWPPPQPFLYQMSARGTYPASLKTLGETSEFLKLHLTQAGYSDFRFFSIRNDGFALVTRMERIDEQQRPIAGAGRFERLRRAGARCGHVFPSELSACGVYPPCG